MSRIQARALQGFVFVSMLLVGVFAKSSSPSPPGRLWDSQNTFGPWVKHGRLVYQSSFPGGDGNYLYQKHNGNWILLQNNLRGINEFLASEINTEKAITGFLSNQMSRFLLATMSPANSIAIQKDLLANNYWRLSYNGRGSEQQLAKLQARLAAYALSDEPKLSGEMWSLQVNVLTPNGKVEQWQVKGSIHPLRISSLLRKTIEKDGSFPVMAQP